MNDAKASTMAMYVHCLLKAGGDLHSAALEADRTYGYEPRVSAALRKAGLATTAEEFLGSWVDVGHLQSTFVGALQGVSAFDTMAPDTVRVPLNQRILIASLAGAAAAGVPEGSLLPVGKLQVDGGGLLPQLVAGILAVSKEALIGGDLQNLRRELVRAVAGATDQTFLGYLAGMAEIVPSAGGDPEGVRADMAAGLEALQLGAGNAVFIVLPARVCKRLCCGAADAMANWFTSDLGPNGGVLANMRVLVSDHIPQLSSDGGDTVLLVDASQLLTGDSGLIFDGSSQALLQADGQLLNLWQSNCEAVRFRRHIGFEIARNNAVVAITNVAWGRPTEG